VSTFDEEREGENIPDENHYSTNVNQDEKEEENWDLTDEVNDNFDPTRTSFCSSYAKCVDYTFAP
jgi:hypothetical protein